MCRIAYFPQDDYEPAFCDECKMTPAKYLREHPDWINDDTSEKEAELYLNGKLKAIFICHEHNMLLCGECKQKHIDFYKEEM